MSAKVKDGYLLKFSPGLVKGWKQKYFVLYQDGQFAFFDSKGGTKTGHVNLKRECRDLQVGAGIQSRLPKLPSGHSVDCLFSLNTSSKKYLILASNRSELDSWLQALNNARGIQATQASYQHAPAPHNNPPQYPAHPPSAYGQAPQPPSLGFEALDLNNGTPGYPPQNYQYPPQQAGYPGAQPGYPPQPPQGSAYPPQQSTSSGYPPQPPPGAYGGYPQQQPGSSAGYPQQNQPYYPPPQGYPQGGYAQPGYNQYGQPPPAGYPNQYGQPQYAQTKQKSGGALGGVLGSLGGAAAGLGAMKMGRKGGGMMGMGHKGMGAGMMGGMGHKAMKNKGMLAGIGGALLGGYALKKASSGWSLGSGHSWGSGGSFGSFSGGSWGSGGS